jgi:hypothetical protein
MNEEVLPEKKKHLTRSEKREIRKQKLKNRLIRPDDIKYQGPISYRVLRIIAWVLIALGQLAFLNGVSDSLIQWNPLGDTLEGFFSFLASIATPLFIVASFGLVLNRKRSYSAFITIYGAGFFAIGLGVCFFYLRYINGLFVQLGIDQAQMSELTTDLLAKRVQVNVFADLFAFSLFNFFLNYSPNKVFTGKKLFIFRLFMIFPLAFVVTSYVLKVLASFGSLTLPFYFYPFFATRNPIIFLVFALASLWIKNRERLFLKLGASKEEYQKYLLTKRNSLSFSINLSLFVILAAVLEAIIILVVGFIHIAEFDNIVPILDNYQLGQAISMVVAIPILFLYSYTREHKNTLIDIFIPIGGIALCGFVYIEYIFQLILKLSSK